MTDEKERQINVMIDNKETNKVVDLKRDDCITNKRQNKIGDD